MVMEATRATFPSVSDIDTGRTVTLAAAAQRWMDALAGDLARQMRASCKARAVHHDTVDNPKRVIIIKSCNTANAYGRTRAWLPGILQNRNTCHPALQSLLNTLNHK